MLSNPQIEKLLSEKDKSLYIEVAKICNTFRNYLATNPKIVYWRSNCHSTCRALVKFIPELKFVDGYYLGFELINNSVEDLSLQEKSIPHSWLITPDRTIIDPQPVAIYSYYLPIMVVSKGEYKKNGSMFYWPISNINIEDRSIKMRTTRLINMIRMSQEWENSCKNKTSAKKKK